MISSLDTIRVTVEQIDGALTDGIAKLAPWLAPIPTAYLVGRATVEHLAWPVWVGIVAAIIVESLGLATTATALTLRDYNASKRKTDPKGPFALAACLVAVYLVVAIGLTVALDIMPVLAVYSPAIFPLLSLCGVTVLALRADHKRRLEAIEHQKAQRRLSKKTSKAVQKSVQKNAHVVQGNVQGSVQNAVLDSINLSRKQRKQTIMDAMMDVYRQFPDIGPTQLAGQLDIARSTVYNYLAELEQAGKVKKNGQGVEVLI